MSSSDDKSVADQTQEQLAPFIERHLALLISAAVIVVFFLRVIFAAHGSMTTTVALLQATNPTTALMPFAATILAPGIAAGVAFGGLNILTDPSLRPCWAEQVKALFLIGSCVIAPSVFLDDWQVLCTVIVLLPLFLLFQPRNMRAWEELQEKAASGDPEALRKIERRAFWSVATWRPWACGFAIAVGISLLMYDKPWIPAERVVTPEGPFTAYVIRETEHELTLLLDKRREVVRIPNGPEVERSLCSFGHEQTSLAQLVLWRNAAADYPDCP